MLKYVDNSWQRPTKIGFANEIGSMAKALGLDSRKLMAEFERDTTLNISSAYLVPGAPYGGSCLPKDLAALNSLANEKKVNVPLLGAIMTSNRAHQDRLLHLVSSDPDARIGIVGAAFKAGSDDIRESPFVGLAESLARLGHAVRIYDRHLDPGSAAVRASFGAQGVAHFASSIRQLCRIRRRSGAMPFRPSLCRGAPVLDASPRTHGRPRWRWPPSSWSRVLHGYLLVASCLSFNRHFNPPHARHVFTLREVTRTNNRARRSHPAVPPLLMALKIGVSTASNALRMTV